MILVFADLKSPLMFDRIGMLKDLGEKVVLVHNADGQKLGSSVIEKYSDFEIVQNPTIKNRTVRYIVSAALTLYLILRHNPKLIIIHWASRLYQNLIFALFGGRCIVHTMGGDIEKEQDVKGHKKPYILTLLERCNTITVKSEYMKKVLLSNFPNVNPHKIEILSWGVDGRFFAAATPLKASKNRLFFSIRALKPFYQIYEIVERFIAFKKNSDSSSTLIISEFGADTGYKESIERLISKQSADGYISFANIEHAQMDEFLKSVDVVVSNAKSDGLPQSLMEAMAAKRLIATNRLPHYEGFFTDGQSSVLFDSPEGMQSAFEKADTMEIDNETKDSDFLDAKLQKTRYIELCRRVLDAK